MKSFTKYKKNQRSKSPERYRTKVISPKKCDVSHPWLFREKRNDKHECYSKNVERHCDWSQDHTPDRRSAGQYFWSPQRDEPQAPTRQHM